MEIDPPPAPTLLKGYKHREKAFILQPSPDDDDGSIWMEYFQVDAYMCKI